MMKIPSFTMITKYALNASMTHTAVFSVPTLIADTMLNLTLQATSIEWATL